jgi:hypothetical protein
MGMTLRYLSSSHFLLLFFSLLFFAFASGTLQAQTTTKYINSGGPNYTSTSSILFEADNSFSPTPGQTYSKVVAIANTDDDPLFQTERYGADFQYNIAGLVDGEYTVELFFAEIFHKQAGKRVFNVDIQSSMVLANFDIYAQASIENGGGSGMNYAITRQFVANVTSGSLTIRFYKGLSGVDNAKISAICIRPKELGESNPPVVVITAPPANSIFVTGTNINFTGTATDDVDGDLSASLSWNSSINGNLGVGASIFTSTLSAGTHIITASVTDSDGNPGSATITVIVFVPLDPIANTICINSGGGAQSIGMQSWSADAYFSTGSATSSTGNTIANSGAEQVIYQSERYAQSSNNLTYQIPTGNGTFGVILYFAEIWNGITGSNQRVFNVVVEGITLESNFDIYAQVGSYAALTLSTAATVTDGFLTIQLNRIPNKQNPKINGICVGDPSILPVELISFSARMENGGALLSWKTAAEINNEGFWVEKSLDGRAFEPLDFVPGAGNSITPNTYEYFDAGFRQQAYYRLMQVDYDGAFTYSPIVSLFDQRSTHPGLPAFHAFPNPSSGHFELRAIDQIDESRELFGRLTALAGGQSFTLYSGALPEVQAQLNRHMMNLPSGMYVLELFDSQGKSTLKLIKQ